MNENGLVPKFWVGEYGRSRLMGEEQNGNIPRSIETI
jgi:hypothetical protein